MSKKLPQNERRWFKVRGYYTTDPAPKKQKVEILQVTVPITGSFHDLMAAASKALIEEHQFFAANILDHSTKRECVV